MKFILKSKFRLLFLTFTVILAGCSGRSPEPDWTAEEYFIYAREKFEDEDYFDAINDLTVVILRYPGSVVADSAQFLLAGSHFYLEEYIISAAEYGKLINNMPQSSLVPDALYMQAESYYQMSPRAELDQEYSLKALRTFQRFLEDYPRHNRREDAEKKILELRLKLAKKQFQNAELYRAMQEYPSSVIYYDIVLDQYYDTEYADDALYRKAWVYMEMGDIAKARENLLIFKEKFPDSPLTRQINRMLDDVMDGDEADAASAAQN